MRNVYTGYLGWFQGDPTALDPLPAVERARRYVARMGGRDAVIRAAREAYDAGDHQWCAELLTFVIRIDHADTEARRLKAQALRQLGLRQMNINWRNFYLSAALELEDHLPRALQSPAGRGASGATPVGKSTREDRPARRRRADARRAHDPGGHSRSTSPCREAKRCCARSCCARRASWARWHSATSASMAACGAPAPSSTTSIHRRKSRRSSSCAEGLGTSRPSGNSGAAAPRSSAAGPLRASRSPRRGTPRAGQHRLQEETGEAEHTMLRLDLEPRALDLAADLRLRRPVEGLPDEP